MLDFSVDSPAIYANNCVMKFKFDRVYGYHHSFNDNIMRTIDVMGWSKARVGVQILRCE